jgi:hypothetical protein
MELALTALASFGTAGAAATGAAGVGAAAAGVAGTAAGTGALATGATLTAGAAGAAAGGGGLLAALGGASTLSLLSGGLTAVSVLQKLNQGEMQAQQAEFKAKEAANEAIGEEAAGANRAATLKRNLVKVLGENDLAYAASGIDLSYGEAASAGQRATDRAYGELSTDRATTSARIAGYDARTASYSTLARRTRTASLLDAVVTGGEGIARQARRGVV